MLRWIEHDDPVSVPKTLTGLKAMPLPWKKSKAQPNFRNPASTGAGWSSVARNYFSLAPLAQKPLFCGMADASSPLRTYGLLLAATLLLSGGWLLSALPVTAGQLPYPLDDSYIHLAIAKQLAAHGQWSLTASRFEFASSAPLYTLLLAGLSWLSAPWAWWPLLVNYLAVPGLLLTARALYREAGGPAGWELPSLLLFVLLAPLPLLLLTGMEHSLHLWATLAGLLSFLRYQRQATPRQLAWLLFFIGLSPDLRYEGLFLAAVAGSILLGQKKWLSGLLTWLAAWVQPLAFGLYSLSQGGPFLPQSVLAKRVQSSPDSSWLESLGQQLGHLFANLIDGSAFMLALLAAAGWVVWKKGKNTPLPLRLTWLAWGGAFGLHLLLAQVGGFRYEAYLIGSGLLLFLPGWLALAQEKKAVWLLLALSLPLWLRLGFFGWHYPDACRNIYQQQRQMAAFLQRHYPTASVAVNDIGAVSYYNDLRLTDLLGLSDRRVQRARQAGAFDQGFVTGLAAARNIELAVVHDEWVGSVLPAHWVRVASWTIPDNFICAFARVSWYAARPEQAGELRRQLQIFEKTLPAGVQVLYFPPSMPRL